MNIGNKIILSSWLITITMASLSMDKEVKLDIKQDSPEELSYILSFPLPTLTTVTNAISSLCTTANNYFYDDEAFKKLGWPSNDKEAQVEFEKTQLIYKRMNEYFKTRVRYDLFLEDRNAIGRRYGYCQRVLEALPTISKRAYALELATFCLTHHRQAMNDFDKAEFLLFVTVEIDKATQEVRKVDSDLGQLTIDSYDANELLNNLLKQTVSVKHSKDKNVSSNSNGGQQDQADNNGGQQDQADNNGGQQDQVNNNGGQQDQVNNNGGQQDQVNDNGGKEDPTDKNGKK